MGAALAAASGLGFGAFQSINRRAAAGIRSAYVSTFLQLVVALVVLVVASVTAADPGRLSSATAATIAWFGAAGAVHFFCGWTLLNMSQERIGAGNVGEHSKAVEHAQRDQVHRHERIAERVEAGPTLDQTRGVPQEQRRGLAGSGCHASLLYVEDAWTVSR